MQKFKRGSRVFVSESTVSGRSHFPVGFEAIICYTYAQEHGGDNYSDYSILKIKDGRGVNEISWYPECDLRLISDDTQDGLRIIENYKYPQQ